MAPSTIELPKACGCQDDAIDLRLDLLKLGAGTQPREMLNNETIAEYAEEMIDGKVFPAITVCYDGANYYPSDGFHRIKAAQRAKLQTIRANVVQGDKRAAVLASFGANSDHGLRRSTFDKRRAATRMIEDPEWSRMSDSEIARRCRVSPGMVAAHRLRLGIEPPPIRETTRLGKRVLMNTSQIGTREVPHRTPVLDSDEYRDVEPMPEPPPSRPSLFDALLRKVRARGMETRTHVCTEFGTIDIVTPEAIYILAGAMTRRILCEAFVTLLFQRDKKGVDKRAVIVGTAGPDLLPWVKQAKKHGIEFMEFKG